MSGDCKMHSIELGKLRPKWVELTDTKGVLRCLRAEEDPERARGIIILCPRCSRSQKTQHYCIFLFTSAPEQARPHGRFQAERDPMSGKYLPLTAQTIHSLDEYGRQVPLLRPNDLRCHWEGYCLSGRVSWRPSFSERMRSV